MYHTPGIRSYLSPMPCRETCQFALSSDTLATKPDQLASGTLGTVVPLERRVICFVATVHSPWCYRVRSLHLYYRLPWTSRRHPVGCCSGRIFCRPPPTRQTACILRTTTSSHVSLTHRKFTTQNKKIHNLRDAISLVSECNQPPRRGRHNLLVAVYAGYAITPLSLLGENDMSNKIKPPG